MVNDDDSTPKPLTFSVNLKDIKQIKRSSKDVGWQYLVFILFDGVPLPAFHFHSGGVETFLSTLKTYAVFTEDSKNKLKFNITMQNQEALTRSLDELNIFNTIPLSPKRKINKFLNDPFAFAIDGLSKIGGQISDALSDNTHLQGERPSFRNQNFHVYDLGESYSENSDHENYELLSAPAEKITKILEKSYEYPDPVSLLDFESTFVDDGKIADLEKLKSQVFERGLENDEVRNEVWPYLLNLRDAGMNHKEYQEYKARLTKEYKTLKTQWMTISSDQEKRWSEYNQKKSLIQKDLIRTDRNVPEFEDPDSPEMIKLNSVLMTY